jgi:hypothetical protein
MTYGSGSSIVRRFCQNEFDAVHPRYHAVTLFASTILRPPGIGVRPARRWRLPGHTRSIRKSLCRNLHPRPDFQRKTRPSLNRLWDYDPFQFDTTDALVAGRRVLKSPEGVGGRCLRILNFSEVAARRPGRFWKFKNRLVSVPDQFPTLPNPSGTVTDQF